ncbi:transmembrane and immunoglobulin domain-containing protein 2 [Microcebus murinus]|uniref:transmembrane and immunoglobulin domain-containing protein 2 n=1 Tax=Microcebus murinus TaxID=30608 RepID=UPI003F6C3E40
MAARQVVVPSLTLLQPRGPPRCASNTPAPQGASSLLVHQEPTLLRVQQGSRVTLACQVAQAQAWEQLRIGWTKDDDILCEPHITNDSLSLGLCGPRGRLSWRAPGAVTLRLDRVTLSDSGHYVCWAVMEIPELDQASGNGTRLLVDAGLLYVLPTAGAVAAIALGAGIWGCRRRGRDAGDRPGKRAARGRAARGRPLVAEAGTAAASQGPTASAAPPAPPIRSWGRTEGNPLYSNILFRPQGAPKKHEAGPGEGKGPAAPGRDQNGQSVYSTPVPQPAPHCPSPAPKPCPGQEPSHYVPMARVCPCPGPAGPPRPRGLPAAGQESETPGDSKRTPPPVAT